MKKVQSMQKIGQHDKRWKNNRDGLMLNSCSVIHVEADRRHGLYADTSHTFTFSAIVFRHCRRSAMLLMCLALFRSELQHVERSKGWMWESSYQVDIQVQQDWSSVGLRVLSL